MSILSYISPERQNAAKDFIRWFAQEGIQAKWAELGGYTCNKQVLASDIFLNATPFNPAFAKTMTFVKDFWNVPVYGELLEVTQRELSKFIVEGVGTGAESGVGIQAVPTAESFGGEEETAREEAAAADGVQKLLEVLSHLPVLRGGGFQHHPQEGSPFLFADDLEHGGEKNVPTGKTREHRMGFFNRCDEVPMKTAEHRRQGIERCARRCGD